MDSITQSCSVLIAILIALSHCSAQGTSSVEHSTQAVPSTTASLEIAVLWKGDLPKRKGVTISSKFRERNPEDTKFCDQCRDAGTLFDEGLVIDEATKGIRDVAVLIRGLPASKTSGAAKLAGALTKATIDNRGCRFSPHVQWAPIGQAITIKNSDPFIHNARILGRGGRQWWNALIPASESVETHPLKVGGVYSVVCDVHPWMKCWVVGTSNPWVGVTNHQGQHSWPKLSISKPLTIHLWHPTLGRATKVIPEAPAPAKKVSKPRILRLDFSQKDFRR